MSSVATIFVILASITFHGINSRPLFSESVIPSTAERIILDAAVEAEVEKRLTSLLAEGNLARFLKEATLASSSRDLLQRIMANRNHLSGNMMRYG